MKNERKNVTWRVAEHPEHKKLNQWLDSQRHIQQSIANIVLHMIDRFGYVDITDYQVQKQLYGEWRKENQPLNDESTEEVSKETDSARNVSSSAREQVEEQEKQEDDIYSGVDTNNI